MTVGELIEKLKEFPEGMRVVNKAEWPIVIVEKYIPEIYGWKCDDKYDKNVVRIC